MHSEDTVNDAFSPLTILENILIEFDNKFQIKTCIEMAGNPDWNYQTINMFQYGDDFYKCQIRLFELRQLTIKLSSVTFKYRQWDNHLTRDRDRTNISAHNFVNGFDVVTSDYLKNWQIIDHIICCLKRIYNKTEIKLLLEYSKANWRFDISFMDDVHTCLLKICFNGQWRNKLEKDDSGEMNLFTNAIIFDEDRNP